ncbi:uncharacterized protein N7529_009429 [Penicillium soppii]|jgi:hypothetical protein|uniref:uncharacterized protein n=1 Tax=Penicillium soppii TaxID=69789 RepID=UPI002548F33B|nr:uncharacterized protein N7529_009429 [Penicillium soppii]KAJ5855485.1 hypothetical protein N7529_009429 [Penicillium soppii]
MHAGPSDDEGQTLFNFPSVPGEKYPVKHRRQTARCCGEHLIFSLLFITLLIPLTLSILLVYGDAIDWHLPGNLYTVVNEYRTSVQTGVQVISAILAGLEVFALCRLINLATRIHFTKAPVSLNMLGFWSALSTPTTNWGQPFWMILITLLLSNVATVFSALWTGALTPINAIGTRNTTIHVPDWSNISLIQEYPSQIDRTGLNVRNADGHFTFSVGVGLLGSLLASANSASPVDGGVRSHNKLDNTRYTYYGRSYSAGSSVGLLDQSVLDIFRATNYTYSEIGLSTTVSCIHNSSSEFILSDGQDVVYPAQGKLPDSTDREYSSYIGYSTSAIVAIGVAAQPSTHTAKRYMAFAAGDYYSDLDKVQCAVTFVPTRFNVTVNISDRNITVRKVIESSTSVHDIDPHHNITHVTMRQLELISNDQTCFYRSTVGDTFNASISDYRTSITNSTKGNITESAIIMKGVENALTSLLDDMLVAYASAQSIVAGFKKPAPTLVYVAALRVGSRGYIISSASIIVIIIVLVIAEAIRMRGWRELPIFDYLDDRMLVVGASDGGRGIAEYAERNGNANLDHIPIVWRKKGDGGLGEISIKTTVDEDTGIVCVRGKVVDQDGNGML